MSKYINRAIQATIYLLLDVLDLRDNHFGAVGHVVEQVLLSGYDGVADLLLLEGMDGDIGIGASGGALGERARVDDQRALDILGEREEARGHDEEVGGDIHLPMANVTQIQL